MQGDLISRKELIEMIEGTDELLDFQKDECIVCISCCDTVQNVISLPCKVGDTVWGIKVYKNFLVAKQGTVREMYFTQDMKLAIGLYGVCRGEFGKRIFRTQEETEQAIMDMGYVRSETHPRFFKKGERA